MIVFFVGIVVLTGGNAFSFHRDILVLLKPVTLLMKGLRYVLLIEGNGSRTVGSEHLKNLFVKNSIEFFYDFYDFDLILCISHLQIFQAILS